MKRLPILAAIAALLISGCGGQPTTSPTPTSGSPHPTLGVLDATLYYVADTQQGLRLYSELHQVQLTANRELEVVKAVVENSSPPLDPDYVNLWASKPNKVLSVTVDGADATVDLNLAGLNVGSEGEARAIDQVVWTLADVNPEITRVKILVNGETVESLAGHVDATGWFTKGGDCEKLASVLVRVPEQGMQLSNPVVVSGTACTFESNVTWQLLQGGKVVKSGATTAGEMGPTHTPWSVNLGSLKPGTYTFRAYDLSAKDGSLVSQDTREFSVK